MPVLPSRLRNEADLRGSRVNAAGLGCVLALGLLLLALPRGSASPPHCSEPSEVDSVAGWTRSVACGVRGQPLRGPAGRLFGLTVELNGADPLTLETLPEIGPLRAQAIVQQRVETPFCSVGDLLRVPGIGEKRLARLSGLVHVEAPASCHAKPGKHFSFSSKPAT